MYISQHKSNLSFLPLSWFFLFRFNVAITRMKALLIVVGNPLLLRIDPYWKRLIDYAYDNGTNKIYTHEPATIGAMRMKNFRLTRS
jgi:hypothetical protein